MPKLAGFTGVSNGWSRVILGISTAAVRNSIKDGAEFMSDSILDSPTSHPWHLRKNEANGFPNGARIGNTNPGFGEVDPNSGKMLASITSSGPLRSGQGNQVFGLFGWLTTQEDYFIEQDSGDYKVGAGMGMGLLNSKGPGSGGVLRKYGAKVAAEQSVVKSMLAAGLKYTGEAF
jgi:hypothetical protein